MIIHIVDEAGTKQPDNKVGEVVIESPYLASGYWNKSELNNEKFESSENGCRRYHTGDIGRLDSDGCLTHLGRTDLQVKITGDFVDIARVESVLYEVRGITQAVVHHYQDDTDEHRLAAYIITNGSVALTVTDIRNYLIERMAAHMIPTAFVFLDELPLSDDFKVDRRQLPPPGKLRPTLKNKYTAPESSLEKELSHIWSDVLEIQHRWCYGFIF